MYFVTDIIAVSEYSIASWRLCSYITNSSKVPKRIHLVILSKVDEDGWEQRLTIWLAQYNVYIYSIGGYTYVLHGKQDSANFHIKIWKLNRKEMILLPTHSSLE